MPGFARLQKWKVTKNKDNEITDTQPLGYKWFNMKDEPECYKTFVDENGDLVEWAPTQEVHFGPFCPKD